MFRHKFTFSRIDFWFLFKCLISFVIRKVNSTIEQQKPDRLLFSKLEFSYQITQRNENFPFDHFSQVELIKSNERIEDSYIGLVNFFVFFFIKKS